MSNQPHPHPLPLLARNHTAATDTHTVLLAPDGGVYDQELEDRWHSVKARLSAVRRNMQDHPLKTLPAEWVNIYTDVAKLYTQNDALRKRRMYIYVRQFIRELVKNQLQHLRPLGGTVLLSEYVRRWRTTMTYIKFMKRVLHHLQRFWISEHANTLKHDPVRPLDKLLMFYWREDLLSNLHSVVDIALALVDDDRRGETIDHAAVRGIVDNFVEIGAADVSTNPTPDADNDNPTDSAQSSVDQLSTLQLYLQVFEDRYLVHTRKFYKEEGARMAKDVDVSTFIKRVLARLDEEEQRAQKLLHQDSASRVRQAAEEQLIGNHKEFLQKEANKMIQEGREQDLRLVYSLLNRIEGGLNPVRNFFVGFVRAEGNSVVVAHVDKLNGKEDIKYNLVLVELLIRLYLKHANMVKRCFDGSNMIMLAIDDAFRGFVNRSLGSVSLPNLLAHYIDHLLRSNKPAGSLFLPADGTDARKYPAEQSSIRSADQAARRGPDGEKALKGDDNQDDEDPRAGYLDELVRFFMYLDDKDMFFDTHRRLFAKRLLANHDEDMETLFITKLRVQMGTTYTQRLSGMLQDIVISNSLREDFTAHIAEKRRSQTGESNRGGAVQEDLTADALKIDFNGHVLNALHWPSVKASDLRVPPVLKVCQQTFADFYVRNKELRKLTWIHSMSTVHLKAHFGKTIYTLVLSTFQACILLLFNERAHITVPEAAKMLNIGCDELKRHVKPLIAGKKSKLLTLKKRPVRRQTATSDNAVRGASDVVVADKLADSRPRSGGDGEHGRDIVAESTVNLVTLKPNSLQMSPNKHQETDSASVPIPEETRNSETGEESRLINGSASKELTMAKETDFATGSKKRIRPAYENNQELGGVPAKRVRSNEDAVAVGHCSEEECERGDQRDAAISEVGQDGGRDGVVELKEHGKDEMEELLSVNLNFVSRQHRIVVPTSMPKLASAEAAASRKNVVMDRSTQVDAAIVRIMKARKEITHMELCSAVISHLSSMLFMPDPKLIKTRLERLIEQEYIARDEQDVRLYKYVA